jgi:hypothetical protein
MVDDYEFIRLCYAMLSVRSVCMLREAFVNSIECAFEHPRKLSTPVNHLEGFVPHCRIISLQVPKPDGKTFRSQSLSGGDMPLLPVDPPLHIDALALHGPSTTLPTRASTLSPPNIGPKC